MDIINWLNSTETPDVSEKKCSRALLCTEDSNRSRVHRKPKECRKQQSRAWETCIDTDNQPVDPQRKRNEQSTSCGSSKLSCSSHTLSTSSTSHEPTELFRRKKRCRTRQDLDIPYSGERKRRSKHAKEKIEDKQRKKKYHQTARAKKEHGSGNSLVRNFHTNNAPKGRLTLQSHDNLGLFRKGRASSLVRGGGLPDLAFSEMRFLQGQKSRKDEGIQNQVSKPPRRSRHNNRKPQHEEEAISTYFTNETMPLKEKYNPPQFQRVVPEISNHAPELHGFENDTLLPQANGSTETSLVDVPNKSFLGFGSRGNRTDNASFLPKSEEDHHRGSHLKGYYDAITMEENKGRSPMLEVTGGKSVECTDLTTSLYPRSIARIRNNQPNILSTSLEEGRQNIVVEYRPKHEIATAPGEDVGRVARIPVLASLPQEVAEGSLTRSSPSISKLLEVCDEIHNVRLMSDPEKPAFLPQPTIIITQYVRNPEETLSGRQGHRLRDKSCSVSQPVFLASKLENHCYVENSAPTTRPGEVDASAAHENVDVRKNFRENHHGYSSCPPKRRTQQSFVDKQRIVDDCRQQSKFTRSRTARSLNSPSSLDYRHTIETYPDDSCRYSFHSSPKQSGSYVIGVPRAELPYVHEADRDGHYHEESRECAMNVDGDEGAHPGPLEFYLRRSNRPMSTSFGTMRDDGRWTGHRAGLSYFWRANKLY